jgi:hypothetical protein
MWVGLGLFALVYRLQRRRGRSRLGWYPSAGSLGNALQTLQVFTQPRAEHAVIEQMEEDVEDDDEGGPDDPVAHLQRQGRRIRRGKQVGPITARVGRDKR